MARKSRKQIQMIEHLTTEFQMTVGYVRSKGLTGNYDDGNES